MMAKKVKQITTKKSSVLRLFTWVKHSVLLIVGILSVIAFFLMTADLLEKYQSRQWLATQATVSALYVYYFPSGGGRMNLRYDYRINLNAYSRMVEERVSKKSGISGVTARWNHYEQNGQITVFYNPQHPQQSLQDFERIKNLGDFLLAICGAMLILLFGGIVCSMVAISGFRAP